MGRIEFQRIIDFNLNSVTDLNLFEYFHLVRCLVLATIEAKRMDRPRKAREIASVIGYSVGKLDARYGRHGWTRAISEHADIFFEKGRDKPALTWEAVINLFPNLYDNGFDQPVLQLLAKNVSRVDPRQALLFDELTADRMDYVEAFALCRCFLRHELSHRIIGMRISPHAILTMLLTVVNRLDETMGEGWVEVIEDSFMPTEWYAEKNSDAYRAGLSYRERAIRLFPLLMEFGMVDKALAAWDYVKEVEKDKKIKRLGGRMSKKMNALNAEESGRKAKAVGAESGS